MTHHPLPLIKSISFRSGRPGPALIVTGAVHGNETCGPRAIERVLQAFERGDLRLARGRVTFVPIVNAKAYAQGTREGDRNFNRDLSLKAVPQDYEDHLGNALCPLLAEHDVLLDIHSFLQDGDPFLFMGPPDNDGDLEPFARATEERAFAACLGVERMLYGWLPAYEGSVRRIAELSGGSASGRVTFGVGTTEYMRRQGGYAVTLECGQHEDPKGPDVGERAIHNALQHLRLVEPVAPVRPVTPTVIRLAQAHIREAAGDTFAKPWRHLEPVKAGALIGTFARGEDLYAPEDGYIIFPYPDGAPLTEWIYFGVADAPSG